MEPMTILLAFLAWRWIAAPRVVTQRFEDVPSDKKQLTEDNRPGTRVAIADVGNAKGGSMLADVRDASPTGYVKTYDDGTSVMVGVDGRETLLVQGHINTQYVARDTESQVGAQQQLDKKETRVTFAVPTRDAFARMGGSTA